MDPRKKLMLDSLRRLKVAELQRILVACQTGLILVDDCLCKPHPTAKDVMLFCPIAVAVDLPNIMREPTNEKVTQVLELLGVPPLGFSGVYGTFYSGDSLERTHDLITATLEVINEKANNRRNQET